MVNLEFRLSVVSCVFGFTFLRSFIAATCSEGHPSATPLASAFGKNIPQVAQVVVLLLPTTPPSPVSSLLLQRGRTDGRTTYTTAQFRLCDGSVFLETNAILRPRPFVRRRRERRGHGGAADL